MNAEARSMDHAYVERNAVLNRYRARQLADEEADAFEIHYLDCAACRLELETDDALKEGFKAAAEAGLLVTPAPARRWLAPYALAASLLVAVLAGLLVQQRWTTPPMLQTQVIALTSYRQQGDAPTLRVQVRDRNEQVVLIIDAVQPELERYDITISDATERVVWSVQGLAPQETLNAKRLVASVPSASLPKGDTKLIVVGRSGDGSSLREVETAKYRLQVD